MRRQDEILLLYPGRDDPTCKYLLVELGDLPQAYDSVEISRFLRAQTRAPGPEVRAQTLHVLVDFQRDIVRRQHSLEDIVGSPWTRPVPLGTPVKLASRSPSDHAVLQDHGTRCEPLVRPFLQLGLEDGGALGLIALQTLSVLEGPRVGPALARALEGSPRHFSLGLALAARTDDPACSGVLAAVVRDHGAAAPELCLLAGTLEQGQPVVLDLMDKVPPAGLSNLLIGLPRQPAPIQGEVLGRLGRPPDPWVALYALRAIGHTGDPRYLPHLVRIFDRSGGEFLKIRAVACLSRVPGEASRDLCRSMLHPSMSDVVKAQALESLVRMGCTGDELLDVARPLLASRSLRTRVNALLSAGRSGATGSDVKGPLVDLLMAEDPLSRIEAAYCLGYLQGPSSLDYLNLLLDHDPSLQVRIQAVKSLSRYHPDEAVPRLLPALGVPEPRIRETALLALARYRGRGARRALSFLLDEGRRLPQDLRLGGFLEVMGGLAASASPAEGEEVLGMLLEGLASSELAIQEGALRGVIAMGGHAPGRAVSAVRPMATRGEKLVARAHLALYLGGDLEALDRLVALSRESPGIADPDCIGVLAELGLLVRTPGFTRRYPGPAGALTRTAEPGPETGSHPPAPPGESTDRGSGFFGTTMEVSELSREYRVVELARHLKKPHVRASSGAADLLQGLEAQNYLVGRGPGSPASGRILPVAAGLLALALLVLLGRTLAVPPVTDPIDAPSAGPGGLGGLPRTWIIESVSGIGPGSPRAGTPLIPGRGLITGPRQTIRLWGPGGSRIHIHRGSRLRSLSDTPGGLDVDLGEGTFGFVLTGGSTRIRSRGFRIRCTVSTFAVEPVGGRMTLAVHEGRVELEVEGTVVRELTGGDRADLGPASD